MINRCLSISHLGIRLKKRLKNFLLITAIGLGTFYGYRGYQRRQWFNKMSDSDVTSGKKPRVVVLGTGERRTIHVQVDVDNEI